MRKKDLTLQDKPYVAYTDETGNSGLNLFDSAQPFFWTGTLLTQTDLDTISPAVHAACLRRAGCKELHGSELGLTGIEQVASKIQQLLRKHHVRFLFTRIEKAHLAATKFVDTLLDSGVNEAVSLFHYGMRVNRLYLAHIVIANLDSDDRQEFWEIYKNGDPKGFGRICMRLEARIESRIDDSRTRQLLLDAIRWAIANPGPLIEGTRSPLDSPNVVALTLLVHGLHFLHELTGLKVGTFIHDEQQQLGKHLKVVFELSKKYGQSNPTSPLALLMNVKEMGTFDCNFHVTSSKSSFGLQLLDVALWLSKRRKDHPQLIRGMCSELADYIGARSYISEFTWDAMFSEVARMLQVVEAMSLSPAREAKGRELMEELEAQRIERMQRSLARLYATRVPSVEE
ncbi:MAG: DUF3800 domain-containing protein [Bryobacterales bacterium]|nr:DUF3800 domain-containing protein [Bryobacterales bacterium]